MLLSSTRRVVSALPFEPGPGFTRVRDDVWTAAPEAWSLDPARDGGSGWPEGVTFERVSLHDLFLAYARTRSAA